MKAQWKDYLYGSWLILVFGQIDAKIDSLDGLPLEESRHFGVVSHPTGSFEVEGSVWEAKAAAEDKLRATLTTALTALDGATAARMESAK